MRLAKLRADLKGTNELPTAPIPNDLRQKEIKLTDNARTVLQKRYLRRGEDGKPAENEHEMFWRVAYHVALAEAEFADDKTVMEAARAFFHLLTDLHFFPNSPTFTGAGTPLGQLAACFVLGIDDDMGRSESGIFQTLRDAALIQQTGGGNGFAFSRLRPKGAIVKSSGGEATGPVGFLRVYDQAFGEIAQGGCLTPDTLVFTERGLLRLDEIVTHSEVGWREHDLTVATDAGERLSRSTFNNGVAPVLRVETNEGLSLTGTPNHKVKVMTNDGLVWRRLDELQAGDALAVKLGQHRGQVQYLNTPEGGIVELDAQVAHHMALYLCNREISPEFADLFSFNSIDQVSVPRVIRQSQPEVVKQFLWTLAEFSEHAVNFPAMAQTLAVLGVGIGYTMRVLAQGEKVILNTLGAMGYSSPESLDSMLVAVKSVTPAGESLTLDLEVDDNHTYLANGLVTHNSRRGANMAVLRVDHPDIKEFITCKTDESSITNFNISVGMTDAFMQAVERGESFNLINPQNGQVWETVDARELFAQIVKQAHHNGEPGVLFLDEANRHNPVPQLYELESTNPCGEQFLGPFENCCLGSINLAQLDVVNGKLDWKMLQRMTETATRFLDDVVSANSYVPAVPQLAQAAHRVRRIGLGIMGLADLMYKIGVRYGSEEGQEFAGQVMEFVRYHCMLTSIDLAKERGAFPAIHGSIYDPDELKWQPPTPLRPYTRDYERPNVDWEKVVKGIKKHGIRNGAQSTVAPTGTIATVSGCEGYGCEPVFALAYMRYVNDNGRTLTLQYTSPQFEKALRATNLSEAQINAIIEHVSTTGSCQGAPDLPEHIRHTFVVSADISAEEHIYMQAALQRFVDNAISKTCNFPPGATEDDVAKAYMLGWKLGCKGLTVYVTGSRNKVVLETKETAAKKEGTVTEQATLQTQTSTQSITTAPTVSSAPLLLEDESEVDPETDLALFAEMKKPRPRRLMGRTYRTTTPLGGTYITINENGHGKGHPFELFIHTSKAGSETAAVSEALGRLCSLIMRIASPIPPRERVMEIIRQLEGIGGERSVGFGPQRVRSLPDGIAQVLREYLEETYADDAELDTPHFTSSRKPLAVGGGGGELPTPSIIGDLCPECGEASMVDEEGCRKCYSCNYSEC